MYTERKIRKSGYGDYFAIDEVTKDGTLLKTPLYLKNNEEREIKIRWEFSVTNSNGTHEQSEMLKGFIRFKEGKVEACYDPSELLYSGKQKDWFEPTEYELTNKSIMHFLTANVIPTNK